MAATRKAKSKAPAKAVESTVGESAPVSPCIGMDAIVGRKALIDAANIVRFVAPVNSTMPVLSMALITATSGGVVTVAATDLDTAVVVKLGAIMASDSDGLVRSGCVAVNARRMLDVVKMLPATCDEVAITHTAKGTRFESSANVRITLDSCGVTAGTDYPKLPSTEKAEWVDSDGEIFADMLSMVDFSMCQDETRFHLNGALLESDGSTLRVVSTDGHRLSTSKRRVTAPVTKGVIIRRKAVAELRRLLGKGSCELAITATHLHVRQGAWILSTKLIDAVFPPYGQVIPKAPERLISTDREGLIAALKRAKLAASATKGVTFTAWDPEAFHAGKLTLSCSSDEISDCREDLAAEYTGETVKIAFNPQYLLELLGRMECERVVISLGAALDPGVFRGLDDATQRPMMESEFLGVVMPMRID
jgi:DNA polymerase-3 subunit beta